MQVYLSRCSSYLFPNVRLSRRSRGIFLWRGLTRDRDQCTTMFVLSISLIRRERDSPVSKIHIIKCYFLDPWPDEMCQWKIRKLTKSDTGGLGCLSHEARVVAGIQEWLSDFFLYFACCLSVGEKDNKSTAGEWLSLCYDVCLRVK